MDEVISGNQQVIGPFGSPTLAEQLQRKTIFRLVVIYFFPCFAVNILKAIFQQLAWVFKKHPADVTLARRRLVINCTFPFTLIARYNSNTGKTLLFGQP